MYDKNIRHCSGVQKMFASVKKFFIWTIENARTLLENNPKNNEH